MHVTVMRLAAIGVRWKCSDEKQLSPRATFPLGCAETTSSERKGHNCVIDVRATPFTLLNAKFLKEYSGGRVDEYNAVGPRSTAAPVGVNVVRSVQDDERAQMVEGQRHRVRESLVQPQRLKGLDKSFLKIGCVLEAPSENT